MSTSTYQMQHSHGKLLKKFKSLQMRIAIIKATKILLNEHM